ncbi:unnamed protein product [Albugo candida]|nr:unnamed protein product [Albugo candida]|eukprot:CCI44217.1 unnamed protein product [Albugo candida]
MKSLMVDAFVQSQELTVSFYIIKDEAKEFMQHGSPEYMVFHAVSKDQGTVRTELEANLGSSVFKVGQGVCMKNKWIRFDKVTGRFYRNLDSIQDEVTDTLMRVEKAQGSIASLTPDEAKALKRRNLLETRTRKSYKITKGVHFALKRKKQASGLTKELLEDHGSGAFKRETSMENVLRTHTTAISAQMLYKLANQPEGFQPRKYFSIDRVFRNENMDATHLAEFHQVEGVVADYNLSLGDLIGIIEAFFKKIGITKMRFKPAYNPYTEPSMEIFAFHPDLKKWTEIGNSGVFRPEMLLPMGLPKDVRVIAWGLSLERPTMIKYRIDNIRELFGHKVDLEKTKAAKLYRY